MVMEAVHEDVGDGSMHCTQHPYKNTTPGAICAFCLQEKLAKLVSSSFPPPMSSPTSSSSSPSFRSEFGAAAAAAATSSSAAATATTSFHVRRHASSSASLPISDFRRSKSTTAPRRGIHFLDHHYKRGIFSFLYLSKHSTTEKIETQYKDSNFARNSVSSVGATTMKSKKEFGGTSEEIQSPRKVSRSRSVGCGSRSFSGDFFERISTGFGDCTLRRVESQREGAKSSAHKNGGNNGQTRIKERVKCGGIFSGFSITSSSSSSSSSSQWVSSTEGTAATPTIRSTLAHGRSKSWGWTFASPMRVFSKPSKRDSSSSSNKNATPNLAAIPSLLTVGS